ncbi:MAG: methyl-accepting chemotaxis protein, partial [Alphaproteobacteria bacterium]|nr:methyl-accepting chemotaxis protein [Alphaproteobacteria bacterium]
MNTDNNLDHDFLELQGDTPAERTFLGGMRLGARVRLFVWAGLLTLAGAVSLFVFTDDRLFSALDNAQASKRVTTLAAQLELGIANARGTEKSFLLSKDTALADEFQLHMSSVTEALEKLSRIPIAETQRKHIDTIRDGLAQYDEQFAKIVASEKALGLLDGTGMSLDLQNVTEDLQAKFSTAGYGNLAGQVSRINQEGKETLLSGFKKGVEEIRKRYQTLIVFLKETKIPSKRKKALQDLLKQHETNLLAMINARFSQAEEVRQFDDLLAYLAPSTGAIKGFSERYQRRTAQDLASARVLSRAVLSGGGAGLLVLLLIIGLMVIRSMTAPMRQLATVAGRLADGDRNVTLPALGNSDASGAIARALAQWLEALRDLDQLRRELDDTRNNLKEALSRAEASDMVATDAARAALLSDEGEEPETAAASTPTTTPAPVPDKIADLPGGFGGGGAISSASRQLASFSHYVTAAADDVERTEALIKGLDDATRQMDDMSSLVMAIRDQTNLLAFRSGPKGSGPDNLVILSGKDKEPAQDARYSDQDMAKRFEQIRETTERAERVTGSVRHTMNEVTTMAREIATTASEQAIEATTKLLSQSEYLQNMLDDVISKVKPSGKESGNEAQPQATGP